MYEDEFPLRLAQLRNKKGVSARDMSLSLEQNHAYINNIESGKALPSMTIFFYICEYLKHLDDRQLESISEIVKGLVKQSG